VDAHIFFWFRDNWFPVLQTIGIVGGLVFTGISIRQATSARKASDLLALTEQHRELWNQIYTRPGLERVDAKSVDLLANPITVAEERFLNEVIVHFQLGWQLARRGSLLSLETMRADAGTFFNLPLPKAVWQNTRGARDPEFVQFIEESLKGIGITR
jgi:hypothetical protein